MSGKRKMSFLSNGFPFLCILLESIILIAARDDCHWAEKWNKNWDVYKSCSQKIFDTEEKVFRSHFMLENLWKFKLIMQHLRSVCFSLYLSSPASFHSWSPEKDGKNERRKKDQRCCFCLHPPHDFTGETRIIRWLPVFLLKNVELGKYFPHFRWSN